MKGTGSGSGQAGRLLVVKKIGPAPHQLGPLLTLKSLQATPDRITSIGLRVARRVNVGHCVRIRSRLDRRIVLEGRIRGGFKVKR